MYTDHEITRDRSYWKEMTQKIDGSIYIDLGKTNMEQRDIYFCFVLLSLVAVLF